MGGTEGTWNNKLHAEIDLSTDKVINHQILVTIIRADV